MKKRPAKHTSAITECKKKRCQLVSFLAGSGRTIVQTNCRSCGSGDAFYEDEHPELAKKRLSEPAVEIPLTPGPSLVINDAPLVVVLDGVNEMPAMLGDCDSDDDTDLFNELESET